MKIFISYRRDDSKPVVDRIRDRLVATYGNDAVFRDIESIPPGENFSDVLDEATSTCNVMLVVIGSKWATIANGKGDKRLFEPGDYTRKEVEAGLTHKGILVIPVLVMDAVMPGTTDIPVSISNLLFRNAVKVRYDPDFDPDMQRLVQGIDRFAGTAQLRLKHFEPETIHIPAGSFLMGAIPGTTVPNHEAKQHEVFLPDFRIGKYPVTNGQYEEFVHQTQRPVAPETGWDGQKVPVGAEKLPVVGVTLYDAMAYCEWLSEQTSPHRYSLPNEAQWEKACRAGNQCVFPWGDAFDPTRCNQGRTAIAAVDAYPAQNELGCHDLVGNIRQWTLTLWGEKRISPDARYQYPWQDDGRNDPNASRQIRRVVRGSTYKDDINLLRCSARSGQAPNDVGARIGFRVVMQM